MNIYRKTPLKVIDNIPVFSKTDDYVKNYEKISEDHLSHMQKTGFNPFQREHEWEENENQTRQLIIKYAKKKQKILDVGVGLARLLEPLTTLERYGMDISMGYLKVAKKKNVNVCLSLIKDIPYKENFFDLIACTDVLEHVLDLNESVEKILSVLKKWIAFCSNSIIDRT